MTPQIRTAIAGIAAATMLAQPLAAQQQACVEQRDMADAAVYALPLVYEGFRSKCGQRLRSGGFIAREGDAFIAPYIALQNEKWPGALRVFLQFASAEQSEVDLGPMIGSLPDDAIRPFLDSIVRSEIADEIKPADCAKIERAVELLAPLPPENIGGVVAMMLDLSGVENPSLCPYRPD